MPTRKIEVCGPQPEDTRTMSSRTGSNESIIAVPEPRGEEVVDLERSVCYKWNNNQICKNAFMITRVLRSPNWRLL